MEGVSDWSCLPMDLLKCIAGRVPMIEDFLAFRGVCTSWQAAATKDTFASVSKVPLLMLAEKKDDSDEREFYSLDKRKICVRIPVPGAKGKRCIDVGYGWILTLSNIGEVSLLKPFSSERIELPNFKKSFPAYGRFQTNPAFGFINQAWLLANPSETLNFTLVVTANQKEGFWRNGDSKWVVMKIPTGCLAMTCCKGKVYCLDTTSQVLIWDPMVTDLSNPRGIAVRVANAPDYESSAFSNYLVKSTTGELLIINRNNTGSKYFATGADHFRVMRLNLVEGSCIEIDGLGRDAIFLGNNAAVSVEATKFPGVLKPNCIYFTDDCLTMYYHDKRCRKGGGKDMGIYHVEDRSIERFDVESHGRVCPPLWIFPSF